MIHGTRNQWMKFVENEPSETIVAWVRVLTLAEKNLPNCETGKATPVLALIAVLKSRDAVPSDLFQWIKANTKNRYLPYGDLMDRL